MKKKIRDNKTVTNKNLNDKIRDNDWYLSV